MHCLCYCAVHVSVVFPLLRLVCDLLECKQSYCRWIS